ncbi:hypothetical protein GFS60_06929 (plasmid) [Rhodococcus sp. WAY2]|nr:hypothetical protein GFS60_06929 [Rhodococcus sp. WAY2]
MLAMVVSAAYAIISGGADTVLCYRTVTMKGHSRAVKAAARSGANDVE